MSDQQHIVIRASAGTGKTFQLSSRYLSLLHAGTAAEQIMATTFTRKAAGEIQDRVISRLAEAVFDPAALCQLSQSISGRALTRPRCLQLLTHLTRQLHRLRIGTLDSFFSQIASSFSLELGLPPGWSIIEEFRDAQLRDQSIEAILEGDNFREVSRLMNLMAKGEAQRSVGELVRDTVRNLYALYLETSAEAWSRFPRLQPLSAAKLESVIDQLRMTDLPADKRFAKARDRDVVAACESDWEGFIKGGLAAKVVANETTYGKKPIPPEAWDLYHRLVKHARAVLVEQLAQQTTATYELLAKYDAAYQGLKHRARALRFEDVTRALSQRAASNDLNRQFFRLDSQLFHLLLDEFQDTSLIQWQVLQPLAERIVGLSSSPLPDRLGAPPSVFCVGDVKQAIYGWRGGRSEIFDALESHLPGLQRAMLNESFRSAPPLIDTINRVMANLKNHPSLEQLEPAIHDWCDSFPTHTTARKDLSGYAELATAPPKASQENGANATLRFAAGRVAAMNAATPQLSIGVLARTNLVVAQLVFELRRLEVLASEEGGNPLTDSAAVQLIGSLLRLADHPGDTAARFHLTQSPLGPLLKWTDYRCDAAATELAERVRRDLLDEGYGPTVHRWAELLAPSCDRRDRNRLQQLVELAFAYQPISTPRAADWLGYVQSKRVADPLAANVRVMTIHQAKGLQFDIVVLPDLDHLLVRQNDACAASQPGPAQPIDRVCLRRNADIRALLPEDLQQLFTEATRQATREALCNLYVAMTRASRALYMIIAPSAPNEKNLPKTAAGLLRTALTDAQALPPESLVFAHGDPSWYGREPATPPSAAGPSARESPPLTITLAPPDPVSSKKLEYATPSSLEGGSRTPGARLLQLETSAALALGTLIHAWFEQVQWLDDGVPHEDLLRSIAQRLDTAGLCVDEQLERFRQMLANPAMECVLRRDHYQGGHGAICKALPSGEQAPWDLQVLNERRFAVRDQQRLLAGTMDRLVLLRRRGTLAAADILDYKTDALNAADSSAVEAAVQFYRPQLEAYRRAAAIMFRLPPERIAAQLLFVSAGVRCPVFPDSTQGCTLG